MDPNLNLEFESVNATVGVALAETDCLLIDLNVTNIHEI